MKYSVEGTMYFEGTVIFADEKKTLKEYREAVDEDATIKDIAKAVVTFCVLDGDTFVEGVGELGKDFIIDDDSRYCGDFVVQEEEE